MKQKINPAIKKIMKELIYDQDQITERIKEMGLEITEDYKGKDLIVIGILRGAIFFMTDLLKEIELPVTIDFMALSSYGDSSKSSGVVRILKDLEEDIEGKDVLVVEDIVDTGLTLNYLIKNLENRGAKSVKVAALLDKPERRLVNVEVAYLGFHIKDEFIIGYGLDYAQDYRNLPYIASLKEEVYENN